jgi:hypothetical protein
MSTLCDNISVKWLIVALLVCGVFLASCAVINSSTKAQWKSSAPPETFLEAPDKSHVLRSNIYRVEAIKCPAAVVRLERSACIEVSKQEAESFVGQNIQNDFRRRFFLVRGLLFTNLPGSFDCIYYERKLSVSFEAMGSVEGFVAKQPMIVLLPDKPKVVYIECSVMQ